MDLIKFEKRMYSLIVEQRLCSGDISSSLIIVVLYYYNKRFTDNINEVSYNIIL